MKFIIETENQYSPPEKSQKEMYDKYYKKEGWLFSKEADAIYYEVDIPFMPHIGQMLGTKEGISIVKWAIYELDPKGDSFFDKSRIIIRDQ
jgi:hypothetical protein|tara:strand:+ start:2236 stop:2508 length:273 start_codon:yes stop_codon:yes gene_type:complete